MPGIFLFWHSGEHLYIYKNTEVGTKVSLQYVRGNFMKNILRHIFSLLLLATSIFGQKNDSTPKTKNEFNYSLPDVKYGGIVRQNSYYSQLYIACYPIGHTIKETADGRRTHILGGISYSRMFSSDNISIFPYYGRAGWYGTHLGVKVEPLFNIQGAKFEYTNFEMTFGWLLSLSLTLGVPNNFEKKSLYYGFKIGYAFPYPLVDK
jgi:hypothetical protein